MEALKAEMARKRAQMKAAADAVAGPDKKFFKRGDLEAHQTQQYWDRYYAKHKARRPNDPATSEAGGSSEEAKTEEKASEAADASGAEVLPSLSLSDVRKRLRERAEPILLFGETETETRKRLRQLELEAPELRGLGRNEWQGHMNTIDQELIREVAEGSAGRRGKHDVGVEEELGDITAIRARIKQELGMNEDPMGDSRTVYDFYNYLLQRWGRDLNGRDEEAKSSAKGRQDSAIHLQTSENLRPLFAKLQAGSVASDIREHLVAITILMAEGDYVLANTAYMEMAIGNAPWPVGVTRSGLHQRPGSAKMYVKNIAHVLNDETQRKYIQGLKRLMTKCQLYFPSDPSKCIDYVPHKG